MERYLPLLVIWLHLAEKAVHPIEDLSPITRVIARHVNSTNYREIAFSQQNKQQQDDIFEKANDI